MPGRVHVADPDCRTNGELRLKRHITTRGLEDALELSLDTLHLVWCFAVWDRRLRVVTIERDARFQLPALVYLALAVIHAVAFEASPDHLFDAIRHPAKGAPALVAIALAAIVFGLVQRSWEDQAPAIGVLRVLEPLLQWLRTRAAAVDTTVFALAALSTAYAASLGILELSQAVWPGQRITAPFS